MALNLAALAFFGLCWGLSVPLSKHAVSAGHHPLGMIIWQLSAVVIVFGAYGALKATALHHGRHHVRYLLLIIVLGTLVPNTLSLLALAQLPAGIMALVIATVPIFSLLIALLIKIEVFSFWRMLGVYGPLSISMVGKCLYGWCGIAHGGQCLGQRAAI